MTVDGHWRANDTAMAAAMVLQGLGIGRLAMLVGDPLVRQGRLVRVLAEFVDSQPVPVYAVTASRAPAAAEDPRLHRLLGRVVRASAARRLNRIEGVIDAPRRPQSTPDA